MKSLKDIIFEANESKDKTFKQIRKGDTIYYLDAYNSDRNHKIEVCTVDAVYYHEPMSVGGYTTSESWEIKFTRKNKNKNGTCIIYKKDIEKKLYIDIGFTGDTIFHYVATDRELLNDFQEEIIDKDVKELENEMEKILVKYESEKAKIQEKIDALLSKKLEKYED